MLAPNFVRAEPGVELRVYQTSPGLRQPGTVPLYEVFELTLALPADYGEKGNFFDVAVKVTFTSPLGRRIRVGGFYYDTIAGGISMWKARLAPMETGTWEYGYKFSHKREGIRETGTGRFVCVEGNSGGFLRKNRKSPFQWALDNGEPFFPMGLNDCISVNDIMQIDGGDRVGAFGGIARVDQYLDAYAAAGFNMFRLSQQNCSPALANSSLTVYDKDTAVYFDWLVQRLRKHDFHLFYGIFGYLLPNDPQVPPSPEVRRFVQYSIDRWGAYVDVWQLQNERSASAQWISKVSKFLRANDPYQHPITTSWQRPELEEVEVNAPHWYQYEDELQSDLITERNARSWRSHGKPVFVGEQGNSTPPGKEFGNWIADSALRMRIRNWTAFCNEISFFFWNNSWATNGSRGGAANIYLGSEERQYIQVLRRFIDLVIRPDTKKWGVGVSNNDLMRGHGLISSDGAAAYIHHFADHTNPVRGAKMTVDIPQAGWGYWLDPATGNNLGRIKLSAGRQELTIPDFIIDIAFLSSPTRKLPTPPVALTVWLNGQADGDLDNDGLLDFGPDHRPFGVAPLKLVFDGSGSHDLDGGQLSYHWRFGDGSPDRSGPLVSHIYEAGTFMTTLTVTDDEGEQASHSFVVRATADPDPQRNNAPSFNRLRDITVREGELLLITPWGNDRELERNGYVSDELSYEVIGLPAGASFGQRGAKWSRQLWWVPAMSQAGQYLIQFDVHDDDGASPLPQVVMVTVLNAPGSPGDLDFDGDVDLRDLALFVECMSGPRQAARGNACSGGEFDASDFDHDGDVDLLDLREFLTLFGQ